MGLSLRERRFPLQSERASGLRHGSQLYFSGQSVAAGIPSFADIADSTLCERRIPWLTIVTVVGDIPSSFATSANELPASRKRDLIHSC